MKFTRLGLILDIDLSKETFTDSVLLRDGFDPSSLFFGTVETDVGAVTVVWCGEGIRYLGFDAERSLEKVKELFPQFHPVERKEEVKKIVNDLMMVWKGEKLNEPLCFVLGGTLFQRDVWRALMHIPTGHVVSYGVIAKEIGRPKAVRAVGSAVGKNPVSLIIPCHRVIQKNGSVCNYGWGDKMKQKLLKMEVSFKKT